MSTVTVTIAKRKVAGRSLEEVVASFFRVSSIPARDHESWITAALSALDVGVRDGWFEYDFHEAEAVPGADDAWATLMDGERRMMLHVLKGVSVFALILEAQRGDGRAQVVETRPVRQASRR